MEKERKGFVEMVGDGGGEGISGHSTSMMSE